VEPAARIQQPGILQRNAAVGAIVYTLATAIVAVTGIDAAASTVIGCAHIAHADGVTLGQDITDAAVLVKAPGLDNVKLANDNTSLYARYRDRSCNRH
jgi:hypothetical protein